jgi:serine/threonine protein kinase
MPYAQGSPSLVGQVIDGRYKITKKLGEGGMGEVYAADHVHIDKKFAIKLLKQEIVSNQEAVTRFQQEARSSSSIKHRNIIAIEDFGKLADGRIYMCMELLDGAALNDMILQPQSVERLLNILIQTGHGLAAAHARNIVHRDMKPENIFVTFQNGEDIPKILDFGIAKVSGNEGQNNLTRTGTIFGTPFYMAPEQALGNPVDARTDIYAMGVIMYEVFAGSLPFQGESFMGILTQHITTEPEPVAQRAAKAGRTLPPGLAEVITCCMQKNPAQRFATMDECVNRLIQIYRGVAGAGMSTYMEAFPVSSAHPAQTPGAMAAVGNAHSATVGVGAPPGAMPSGGHAYSPSGSTPAGVVPSASSSSGLYDPSGSAVAPKKKGNTGLLIAIFAVLAVGGGVAAFVILGQKSDTPGSGSGSQVASNDLGSGSGSATVTTNGSGSGSAVVKNGGGSGSQTVTNNGGGSGSQTVTSTGSAGSGSGSAGSGSAVATGGSGSTDAGAGSGSSATIAEIDAGVAAPKTTEVSLLGNTKKFDVYIDGQKVPPVGIMGDHVVSVPEGQTVKVKITAKGYQDKDLTVTSDSRAMQFSLTKIGKPVTNTNNGSNSVPTSAKCTGTTADLSKSLGPSCAARFCREHTDPKSAAACEVYNN